MQSSNQSTTTMDVRIVIILTLVIFPCAHTNKQENKCDKMTGANYTACGDDICCCYHDNAMCVFKDHQSYIPKLPSGVRRLQFNNKFLPDISRETFYNIRDLDLIKLSLQNNSIVHISRDAFTGYPNLGQLDLSFNNGLNLTQLAISFGSLQKTQHLKLGLNDVGFTALPVKCFDQLNRSNIIDVRLNQNKIIFLNFSDFKDFSSLARLDISHNHIDTVSEPCDLKSLKELRLNNNEIAVHITELCPGNENKLPNLQLLDLSQNFISTLEPVAWKCLKTLNELRLDKNIIEEIPDNIFSMLTELKKLTISNMQCRTVHTFSFNCSSLTKLYMTSNNIIFTNLLTKNPNIINMFNYCPNISWLDMSLNSLNRVDESLIVMLFSPLANLNTLKLVRTRLDRIPPTLLGYFPNLKELILDGNGIQHLENVFNKVKSLQKLSVQGNNIRVIRKEALPGNILHTLKSLNLADNPFECSCDMLWFRDWVANNEKSKNITLQTWPKRYTCRTPTNMMGKHFNVYQPAAASCRYHDPLTIAYITIGSFVGVFIVVSLIIYRKRWYISYLFYKVKLKTQKSDSETRPLLGQNEQSFDGYVIYADEDGTFVHHNFRTMMEENNDYKLHIWHRDAENGSKLEVMVNAMYASNNIVAVISKNFLKDPWCQFQLNVALDIQIDIKRDFVVLVILEDIELKALSKYWCVVLTKTPTAYWCVEEEYIKRKVFEQTIQQHFGDSINKRESSISLLSIAEIVNNP